MKYELNYVEKNLKLVSSLHPDYFDHILSEQELYEYIAMMVRDYASLNNKEEISKAMAESSMSSEFFLGVQNQIISHPGEKPALSGLEKIYRFQTEEKYIAADYDVSYSRILRHLPSQWHTDDFFQIYYARDGVCPIVFHEEEFQLKPGFLMIVAPNVTHATPCFKDDAVLEHFFLRASTFEQTFFNHLKSSTVLSHFFRKALSKDNNSAAYLVFDTGKDEDIARLLDSIIAEATQKLPYSSSLMNALMSQLFILILRRYEHTARLPSIDDFHWKHEFSELLAYIQHNFASLTQTELSERFGYSERQINRIIHKCLNMNYSDLVTFLRMQKAEQMLKRGIYSLTYISDELGYNNPSSFFRAFKKYYRVTPQQYLQELEQE